MRHEQVTLTGQHGLRLFAQSWHPDGPPVGSVVIAHGYAEHSDRYRHVAAALVDAGWSVHALDHRGHGRSGGRRGVTDHLAWLVADLDLVVERATAADEPAPSGAPRLPVLLGHSMGGGLAAAYAISSQAKLSALVLSGPTLGMEQSVPAVQRVAMIALSAVAPGLGTVALPADAVSRDPEVVAAYRADPLVFHGKIPARTAREMLRASDLVKDRAGELRLPLLIAHGSADKLVPLAGSRALHADAGSADKTLTVYEGLFHEIFNEPEKDRVIADVVSWVGSRRSAAAP
jgi:alpha-beta hydrolase superfamily lysophospholipase